VVDIITPPTYTCQGEILTEYDVRNIQVQVSDGNITSDVANMLDIKDSNGQSLKFREDGVLVNSPAGFDIASGMTLRILRNKRIKNQIK
jgi:hypothetical protein